MMSVHPSNPASTPRPLRRTRRGGVLIYSAIAVVALTAFGSLAVDYGRVQVASNELQIAADAASRYAVAGLRNRIDGNSAAASNARAALFDVRVDGSPVTFDESTDIQLGIWNSESKTFAATSNSAAANAVRVTLKHNVGGGAGSPPLTLLSMLGRSSCRVTASAVASLGSVSMLAGNDDGTFSYWVPATSNPWLAGMTKGTIANPGNPASNPDYAGKKLKDNGKRSDKPWLPSNNNGVAGNNVDDDYIEKRASPVEAGGITVEPGKTMTFANMNGGANNFNSNVRYTADGNLDWVISNFRGAEFGKSDVVAPINSVIAVFLSDADPSLTSAPSTLDFSTKSSRDYARLQPQLKQVFFLGDGLRDNGEPQQIVVPPGATRMFIGTMDGYEWNNNVGGFEITAISALKVSTVR
jgi:Flp pilus assembly protein TadG